MQKNIFIWLPKVPVHSCIFWVYKWDMAVSNRLCQLFHYSLNDVNIFFAIFACAPDTILACALGYSLNPFSNLASLGT